MYTYKQYCTVERGKEKNEWAGNGHKTVAVADPGFPVGENERIALADLEIC